MTHLAPATRPLERGYQLETHTDAACFDDAEAWRDLEQRDDRCRVFQSFPWLRHLAYLERQSRAALRLLLVRDPAGRLMAAAPLAIERSLGTRVLRFIGHGPADYHDLLWARDADHAVVEALLRQGLCDAAAGCDVIDFNELPPDAHLLERRAALLPHSDDWHAALLPAALGRYVPLQGDFPTYYATLSRKLRSDVRRTNRRLHETHRIELVVEDGSHDPQSSIAELIRLHQKRRRDALDHGLYRNRARRATFSQLFHTMLSQGSLQLVVVRLDGHARAALALFRHKGRIHAYNAGMDSDPALRRFGLGRLCHLHALENAFADHAVEYDLGRGNEPYKAIFRSQPRQNDRLLLCRRGWRSRWFCQRQRLREGAYRSVWVRRVYFFLQGCRGDDHRQEPA